MKIDLGCGQKKREGYIGVDILNVPGVDVIHDLNVFPYPFRDNIAEEIWMDNVLEHLNDPVKVMEEVYRISCNNARIVISVPYF